MMSLSAQRNCKTCDIFIYSKECLIFGLKHHFKVSFIRGIKNQEQINKKEVTCFFGFAVSQLPRNSIRK